MHLKKMRNVATVAQLLLFMSSIATRSSVDDPITNYTRSTGNEDPNNMASTVHTIISNTNNETNLEVRSKLARQIFINSRFIFSKTTPDTFTMPNAEAWSLTGRDKTTQILKIGFSSLFCHIIDKTLISRTETWKDVETPLHLTLHGITVNVLSACSQTAINDLGKHLGTLMQSDPLKKFY